MCITLNNAKIPGIDNQVGSLEPGKEASLVISSVDILDITTNNVELAFIAGRNINLDNKHKQLYRKYKKKYEKKQEEGNELK